jgi:hypothetical protein
MCSHPIGSITRHEWVDTRATFGSGIADRLAACTAWQAERPGGTQKSERQRSFEHEPAR